ncbi:hypothetical protein L198_08220 [Cryptococcus wingfieldii CBS 7118]|uniref:Uncharacterized protein n=1 Tax=Cryptococcus wingfieldii CBS 7118 TaxID=1295528 RepID=A0A1E3HD69_9TREE|nr:hypothetical protein L198_08220 [Cryptococcus wingfieldii CBS 7118]ODN74290.1 hypothetical protein L198_08220 [Cryptococcus wingfieldii CBS 7118]
MGDQTINAAAPQHPFVDPKRAPGHEDIEEGDGNDNLNQAKNVLRVAMKKRLDHWKVTSENALSLKSICHSSTSPFPSHPSLTGAASLTFTRSSSRRLLKTRSPRLNNFPPLVLKVMSLLTFDEEADERKETGYEKRRAGD